ncbi:MAG TPA: hybrid sensor histidine kinase/response regulator [Anaerolineaceae bacterium]|nr:hybrid sensor histidine kinase/response regulator [Anaerolineaceae bacterium]
MPKLKGWVALLMAFITVALWCGVAWNYTNRQEAVLENWNVSQMLLVKNAAAAVQGWKDLQSSKGVGAVQAEQEAIQRFIQPIRVLQDSYTWVYADGALVYDQRPEIPADYLGKTIDQVFAIQKQSGASDYETLTNDVMNGVEGSGWYVWLPQRGRDAAAWTSLKVADKIWVIGLSTPESEILAGSGILQELQGEIFGVGAITLLLWGIFFLILRQHKMVESHLKLLEKSVDDRATLAERISSQSVELAQMNTELENVTGVREEFLAKMGHEMRTPLSTIIGLTYALQCQVYGPVTEKQAKSLETILNTSQHLSSLVADILDLSQLRAGKMRLDIRPFPISLLIESSLAFVDQQSFQKKIKVTLNNDEQVKVIEGDELRLKQLMINLLNNAVKFTPEGGQIGIDIAGNAADNQVDISVWDTGIGISGPDMPRLFKPFVQLDSGTSRQFSGTGLGLSLVVRIAEMHGGSISLSSEVGKGSRFTLRLPWQGNDYGGPSKGSSRIIGILGQIPTQEKEFSILIADDQPENSQLMSDFLTAVGYEVISASSGEETIRICKGRNPDLVLLDLQLVDIDSLKLIESLRSDPSLGDLPIIALTSLVLPGDPERILQAGAKACLQRPVQLGPLAELIHSTLVHPEKESC